ncbi:MAG TPA: hypothetical protein VER32_01390 [Pyrinomonadaceae bacterium]|nr:hypothetical protein [Pyrinomonadaceae bacterium]
MATKKSAGKSSKKSAKKTTKKAARTRGSAKIASASGGGRGFDPVAIKALVTRFRKAKLSPDILIDGTPVPDIIRGTFTARSASGMSDGLKALMSIRDAQFRPVRLFPDGVPIPDIFVVQFEARARRR